MRHHSLEVQEKKWGLLQGDNLRDAHQTHFLLADQGVPFVDVIYEIVQLLIQGVDTLDQALILCTQ